MPATKKTVKKVTTKAAAPKATASKKSAKAKTAACACDVAGQSKSSACKKVTRVIAKYNAGWGNQLYIRGLGGGLDWNVGVPMQCVGEDEWLWEQLVSKGDLAFKILINDEIWNTGDDITLNAGDSITVHPSF